MCWDVVVFSFLLVKSLFYDCKIFFYVVKKKKKTIGLRSNQKVKLYLRVLKEMIVKEEKSNSKKFWFFVAIESLMLR